MLLTGGRARPQAEFGEVGTRSVRGISPNIWYQLKTFCIILLIFPGDKPLLISNTYFHEFLHDTSAEPTLQITELRDRSNIIK